MRLRWTPLLAALAFGAPARAQPPDAGGLAPTTEPPWPDVHYGQPVPVDTPRPRDDVGSVTSPRAAVRVHLGAGVDPALAARALDAAARTLDYCERALRLDGPWPDGLRGGDPGLDVYVRADGPWSETPVDAMAAVARWDRASAFVRVRADADPVRFARAVGEGVARAVVLGVKADHPPRMLYGLGHAIARRALDLPPDLDAVRAFQARPEASVLGGPLAGPEDVPAARGAGLFLDWLLARYDDPQSTLLEGLVAGAAGWSAPDAPRLIDEPDVMDLLRRLFRDEPQGLRGALAEFSAHRALLGGAGDETGYPLRPDLGARARELSWSALPAWVRPAAPLEPTGASLVVIDLGDAPVDGSLSVWLHATPWRRWMVRVLRVGARGPALGTLDTEVVRGGEWSLQLDTMRGAARVVIAVTDLGDETFEPDMPQSANGYFALHIDRGR